MFLRITRGLKTRKSGVRFLSAHLTEDKRGVCVCVSQANGEDVFCYEALLKQAAGGRRCEQPSFIEDILQKGQLPITARFIYWKYQ